MVNNPVKDARLHFSELLLKFWDKKKFLPEFSRQCAYDFIDLDLEPKELPSRPEDLIEYDRLSSKEKSLVSDRFWREPQISFYLEKKQEIINFNVAIYRQLMDFKKLIPENDKPTHLKFEIYFSKYKKFFVGLSDLDKKKLGLVGLNLYKH